MQTSEFEGKLVRCPVEVSEEDWQAAFAYASEDGKGNLTRLSGVFEPCIWTQGRYRLTFKTRRTGWDGCGVEYPTEPAILTAKKLGAKYGMAYINCDECEKGWGDFVFVPVDEQGIGEIHLRGTYYREGSNFKSAQQIEVHTNRGTFRHFHLFKGENEKAERFLAAVVSKNLGIEHFETSPHWEKVETH